jgi:hypothetical protein
MAVGTARAALLGAELPVSAYLAPVYWPVAGCREQERMQKAEQARLETERILREQQVAGWLGGWGCPACNVATLHAGSLCLCVCCRQWLCPAAVPIDMLSHASCLSWPTAQHPRHYLHHCRRPRRSLWSVARQRWPSGTQSGSL